jgi:xanthine dehydrogenase accessory factor
VSEIWERIVRLRQRGGEGVLVTVVEKDGSSPAAPGAKMLVLPDGRTCGTVGGGALETAAAARAAQVLGRRQSELVRYTLGEDGRATSPADETAESESTGMICGGRAALFYDYIGYAAHAYIFGGGHVGRALAAVLSPLGYHVTVLDHRPGIEDTLEAADRVLIGPYETAREDEPPPRGSYFLIATPSHIHDDVVLRRIVTADWRPAYVGMLGSRRKAQSTLGRLSRDLDDVVEWEVIHCPVGLDIGGPTPEEIAISIAAEMQAVRYGRCGHRHMRLDTQAVRVASPKD